MAKFIVLSLVDPSEPAVVLTPVHVNIDHLVGFCREPGEPATSLIMSIDGAAEQGTGGSCVRETPDEIRELIQRGGYG